MLSPLRTSVRGRHVLLIEDLIDSGIHCNTMSYHTTCILLLTHASIVYGTTGLTLDFARKHLLALEPASLRICVLFNKHGRRKNGIDSTLSCHAHFIIYDDVIHYLIDSLI